MKCKIAKEILADSFHELAEKRQIDKITVREIAANCDYSSATFYRQFRDKYDLIAWDYARQIERLMSTTFDILKAYYQDEEEDMYWAQGQLEMIECIGVQNWLLQQMKD